MSFLHGTEVLEQTSGARSVPDVPASIIGLLCTAPDADPSVFPLNEVVLLNSDPVIAAKLDTTGNGRGTALDAINLIYAQGGAKVIVVRVAEGNTLDETMSNIVGSPVTRTGVWAFLTAQSKLGEQPKILIAPGFTSQRTIGAVTNVVVTGGGSGYTSATVDFTMGSGATATATVSAGAVTAVSVVTGGADYASGATAVFTGGGAGAHGAAATVTIVSGVVTAVTITSGGTGYSSAPTVTILPAAGAAATATAVISSGVITGITMTRSGFSYATAPTVLITGDGLGATAVATVAPAANPAVAELESVAQRIRAIWIKDGPNSTDASAVVDRNDYGSNRGFIVDPAVLVWNTKLSTNISMPASSAVAGLIAQVDNDEGYWVSPSNHTISGIVGTARPIDFNIADPNTQSNYLNANQIATIVRTSGFRLWGNRTPSADPLWAFLSVRRTCDLAYDELERAFLWALDRGLTAGTVINIATTVNRFLRTQRTKGAIIDGRCWIDPKRNPVNQMAQGQLVASFDLEPPAPMERLTFLAYRNGNYYTEVLDKANSALQSQSLVA